MNARPDLPGTVTVEVDPARVQVVGGRWSAAVCINPDGSEAFWLLSPNPEEGCGCCCPTCAPHDQLGPMPDLPIRPTTKD